jgi:hypothetical protein
MGEAGRSVWAALHLLDRQIIDRDGVQVAKVDDLQFGEPAQPGDLPVLTDILCGQAALARRFNRRLGRGVELLRRVLDPSEEPGPARISFGIVTDTSPHITIALGRDDVAVTRVDRWLAREILDHIPGSGATRSDRES